MSLQQNLATLPRLENGEVRYARGWFIIGGSDEYKTGEAKPLKYFGKELVAFRGDDGKVHVLDAYCPHLGAHMGYGGEVIGSTIQCPFHHWRFDGEGQCVEIPYAKKIPDRACTNHWTTDEHSGIVFIWHDPEGNEPDYKIPEMEEYGQEGWSDWNLKRLEIKTNPREIIENVADSAHFLYVHHMDEMIHFENEYVDHMATQRMKGSGPGGEVETTATYYGPAFQYTWMSSVVESRLINTNTPIDENTLHLWFGVMIQYGDFSDEDLDRVNRSLETLGMQGQFELTKENLLMIQEAIIAATQQGYYEDVAVWENKLYRPKPVLCDGDGPLAKLRKWYSQFYTDRSA